MPPLGPEPTRRDSPHEPSGLPPGPPGRFAALAVPWSTLALATAIAAFVLIVSSAGWFRTLGFDPTTWDLGIYQQALWSAGHGRTFFEAADWETGGFGTFLQVHSALVLFLLVPIYNALPSAGTLYVVQALVVGLGAVPLFGIVRDAGGSDRRGLGVALLYLGSAPVVSACLYDFHVEAFVPVEIFALFWLWSRQWYVIGAAIAFLAFVTMEAAAVFTAAVGIYFLLESTWTHWQRGGSDPPASAGGRPRLVPEFIRQFPPGVLPALALLIASVVAYYALLELRTEWLAPIAGVPAFPAAESGYVIGGTPSSLGLSFSFLGVGLVTKASYWALVFACVLLLPTRAPRTLVLVAPWMAFTLLSSDLNYVTLGYQYGFFVAAGLFPGVAVAAGRWRFPSAAPVGPSARGRRRRWRQIAAGARPWATAASAAVALNFALSPFDPLMHGAGLGSGYQFSFQTDPAYAQVRDLAGVITPNATVLASDFLFPFVANDVHAYTLFWQRSSHLDLPFNASAPPQFVFLAEGRFDAVPDWLALTLYNRSDFGLRGVVWSTPVGAVSLFESTYNGSWFSEGATPASSFSLPASALTPTVLGAMTNDLAAPGGQALESTPFASGQLWSSAPFDLPAGCYNVTFWVRAWPSTGGSPPAASTLVLGLGASPFSETGWFSEDLNYSRIALGFTPVVFEQRTFAPVFDVVLRGYALTWQAAVGVSSITVADVTCAPPGNATTTG